MGQIEQRLQEMGVELPPAPDAPPGFKFSFAWARQSGTRVFLSGHGALTPDGKPAGPFGRVPSEVSLEAAQESARGAAVAAVGSLKTLIGELDRVRVWSMVYGAVNADVGYPETTNVINGYSDFVLDLFGHDVGQHARMAVGVTAVPLNLCLVVGAEVEIHA
jgi:enamine deaminase RidA (YjgF/YER057c/UK114 family)